VTDNTLPEQKVWDGIYANIMTHRHNVVRALYGQKIEIRTPFSDNEFQMTMHVNDRGTLVCSHKHVEWFKGYPGTYFLPAEPRGTLCHDCGTWLEEDPEFGFDYDIDREED